MPRGRSSQQLARLEAEPQVDVLAERLQVHVTWVMVVRADNEAADAFDLDSVGDE